MNVFEGFFDALFSLPVNAFISNLCILFLFAKCGRVSYGLIDSSISVPIVLVRLARFFETAFCVAVWWRCERVSCAVFGLYTDLQRRHVQFSLHARRWIGEMSDVFLSI